jgi:zinc protease
MKPTRMSLIAAIVVLANITLSSCTKTTWNRDDQPGPTAGLSAEMFVLANGMRVVVHEDNRVPTVKVITKVGVGSADEPAGRAGFAHLFEHLMFMGTKAAPNFDVVMEQVGGSNNAYTDFDETVYYETGPANALEQFLWLEADRFANIPAYMTEEKVSLQREVVLNEMRQNVLDTPGASAVESENTGLFAKGHPYYRPVIGSVKDLEAASKADVVDFFARYYRPSNLTLIIAGDVNTADVRKHVQKYFGKIAEPTTPLLRPPVPTRKCDKCVVNQRFVDAVSVPRITTTFAWPAQRIEGSFVDPNFEILSVMMNDQFASTLQKKLVREDKVANNVSVGYGPKELSNFFTISADAAPKISAETLRVALDNALADLAKTGFTESEVDGAKTSYRIAMAEQLEQSEGRADVLQEVVTRYGDASALSRYGRRFRMVTRSSTRYALLTMLRSSDRVNQVVVPGERGDYPAILLDSSGKPNGKLLTAAQPLNLPKPAVGKPKSVQVPKPQTGKLDNGVTVNFFSRNDAPRVRVVLMVAGGTQRDPLGKEGRGDLLAAMMTRGAGARDATAFTQELTRLGSSISVSASVDSYRVTLSAPPDNLAAVMNLLGDVLRRPTIDQAEVELAQSETISGIEDAKSDLRTQAAYAADLNFYPKGSPSTRFSTISSVSSLKVNDLRAEHKAVFQPQNIEVVAGGPVDMQVVVDALDQQLKGWTNSGPKVKNLPDPRPQDRALQTVLVNVPDASQTRLIFVSTGPGANSSDLVAAEAASFVLGGTFTSRLMQKLREEKGYTYGAAAGLGTQPTYGVLQAYTSVEQSVTGLALKEMLAVLDRFSTGDISKEETATAVSGTYMGSLGLVSTNAGLVDTFAAVRSLGEDWDSVQQDLTTGVALRQADLSRGAKALIDRKRVTLVIAGDLAKVKPLLAGIDMGEVSEFTVDLDGKRAGA